MHQPDTALLPCPALPTCSEHPQILDYIKVKQEVCDMEKAIADLKRKGEIADMEAKRGAATLAQLKTLRKAGSGTGAGAGTGLIGVGSVSMRAR